MAIPVYQIGPFQLFSISGLPDLPYEHAETIQRAGVDGTGFLQTGKYADESELTTSVDMLNWAAATLLETQYRQLCNGATYDIICNGLSYSSLGIGFVIRDVKVTGKQRLTRSVGGLNNGLVWVTARWRVHAVEL